MDFGFVDDGKSANEVGIGRNICVGYVAKFQLSVVLLSDLLLIHTKTQHILLRLLSQLHGIS